VSPHHERAIQNLKSAYVDDPKVLSIIVGGSVAKGWASEQSDVDYMAVVTDDAYEQKRAEERLMTYRTDLTDYEGGYTDGKIVPVNFLRQVAEKGSEPARSAFLGALILFDRTNEIDALIQRILIYPEEGVEERIRRFHSQIMIWQWFVGEAAKRNDPYLMARATTEVSLFSMRLILAVNRRLYPYHKWVTRTVEESANKPDGIVDKLHAMIRSQTVESTKEVIDAIHEWHPLKVDYGEHCHHFLEDSEWNWMHGAAPIADR